MKAVLIIALVAALGGVYYYQQKNRTLAATVSELGTEARENKREIDKLEKALEDAEKALAKAKAEKEAEPSPVAILPQAKPEAPALVEAPAPVIAPKSDDSARIEQARADYAAKVAALDRRQAEVDAARQRAQAYLAQVEASARQFSEQSDRFDDAGNRIGKKGVRTSQADREKAMAIYAQQLAGAKAGIAKVDEEQAKVNAARAELARLAVE